MKLDLATKLGHRRILISYKFHQFKEKESNTKINDKHHLQFHIIVSILTNFFLYRFLRGNDTFKRYVGQIVIAEKFIKLTILWPLLSFTLTPSLKIAPTDSISPIKKMACNKIMFRAIFESELK